MNTAMCQYMGLVKVESKLCGMVDTFYGGGVPKPHIDTLISIKANLSNETIVEERKSQGLSSAS